MRRRPILVAVNWVMAALFAVAAAVQLNDPDPAGWVGIYGAAALGCLAFGRLPRAWVGQAALAAVAVVWGVLVLSGVSGPIDTGSVFALGMKMRGDSTELIREAGGLGLIAVWMAALAAVGFRAR